MAINEISYKGNVYDFNIEDNHNYTVVNLGLVHNSGKRNGSIAIYLEPWHADIQDFLDLKKPHGNEEDRARDLFYALWIPDLFMERVRSGGIWSLMCPDECKVLSDVWGAAFVELYEKYESEGKFRKQMPAQELWFKIMESQIETGTPYILYKDAANSKSNQQNLGTIKSSNLCVAPDTMILTQEGYYPIKELKDQKVNVWNGKEFSETVVHQTGTMQKLITIKFDNGIDLKCTPYHKFYIETGLRPADKSKPEIIEAQNLQLGMRIIRYNLPIINTNIDKTIKYPYTQGLFAAEGTYQKYEEDKKHQCEYQKYIDTDFCKRHQNFEKKYDNEKCSAESYTDRPYIWLYDDKKSLIKYIDWIYSNENVECNRLDVAIPHDILDKFFVPLNYNIETKIKWLEGYLDGDGSIIELNGIKNIQVSSIEEIFIKEVHLMLQTMGINATISISREKGYHKLPDGKGGEKDYMCQKIYRMNIDCESLHKLIDLGYKPKRLDISNIRLPHHKTNKYIRVAAIIDNSEVDDTYCFNEPKEHKGIFNGILTGQCTEIIEYESPEETAVCNLNSICLPTYITIEEDGTKTFNFEKLHEIAMIATKNLNKIIDINFYPVEKARRSNLKHRPIGIGIQGLADTYIIMGYPFDSKEAADLNKMIFETIYHGAIESSMLISKKRSELIEELKEKEVLTPTREAEIKKYLNLNEFEDISKEYPGAYSTFSGSPMSKGLFQFDLWNVNPGNSRYDWDKLRSDILKYGIRNSLLVAPMPTASTSQIMGLNEAAECITSNIYKRKTLAGEFILVNKYLIKDLINEGIWNKDMKNKILLGEGSVQHIPEIPEKIRKLYKTVWEISQKVIIDQAADRGPYICQSQSMNLFIEDPDFKKLTSMAFYTFDKKLKTGCYYLRSKPKAKTQQFTIDPSFNKEKEKPKLTREECTPDENGVCQMCSS
jgi:ribonucleoside-diphosphate reductase alpha chain